MIFVNSSLQRFFLVALLASSAFSIGASSAFAQSVTSAQRSEVWKALLTLQADIAGLTRSHAAVVSKVMPKEFFEFYIPVSACLDRKQTDFSTLTNEAAYGALTEIQHRWQSVQKKIGVMMRDPWQSEDASDLLDLGLEILSKDSVIWTHFLPLQKGVCEINLDASRVVPHLMRLNAFGKDQKVKDLVLSNWDQIPLVKLNRYSNASKMGFKEISLWIGWLQSLQIHLNLMKNVRFADDLRFDFTIRIPTSRASEIRRWLDPFSLNGAFVASDKEFTSFLGTDVQHNSPALLRKAARLLEAEAYAANNNGNNKIELQSEILFSDIQSRLATGALLYESLLAGSHLEKDAVEPSQKIDSIIREKGTQDEKARRWLAKNQAVIDFRLKMNRVEQIALVKRQIIQQLTDLLSESGESSTSLYNISLSAAIRRVGSRLQKLLAKMEANENATAQEGTKQGGGSYDFMSDIQSQMILSGFAEALESSLDDRISSQFFQTVEALVYADFSQQLQNILSSEDNDDRRIEEHLFARRKRVIADTLLRFFTLAVSDVFTSHLYSEVDEDVLALIIEQDLEPIILAVFSRNEALRNGLTKIAESFETSLENIVIDVNERDELRRKALDQFSQSILDKSENLVAHESALKHVEKVGETSVDGSQWNLFKSFFTSSLESNAHKYADPFLKQPGFMLIGGDEAFRSRKRFEWFNPNLPGLGGYAFFKTMLVSREANDPGLFERMIKRSGIDLRRPPAEVDRFLKLVESDTKEKDSATLEQERRLVLRNLKYLLGSAPAKIQHNSRPLEKQLNSLLVEQLADTCDLRALEKGPTEIARSILRTLYQKNGWQDFTPKPQVIEAATPLLKALCHEKTVSKSVLRLNTYADLYKKISSEIKVNDPTISEADYASKLSEVLTQNGLTKSIFADAVLELRSTLSWIDETYAPLFLASKDSMPKNVMASLFNPTEISKRFSTAKKSLRDISDQSLEEMIAGYKTAMSPLSKLGIVVREFENFLLKKLLSLQIVPLYHEYKLLMEAKIAAAMKYTIEDETTLKETQTEYQKTKHQLILLNSNLQGALSHAEQESSRIFIEKTSDELNLLESRLERLFAKQQPSKDLINLLLNQEKFWASLDLDVKKAIAGLDFSAEILDRVWSEYVDNQWLRQSEDLKGQKIPYTVSDYFDLINRIARQQNAPDKNPDQTAKKSESDAKKQAATDKIIAEAQSFLQPENWKFTEKQIYNRVLDKEAPKPVESPEAEAKTPWHPPLLLDQDELKRMELLKIAQILEKLSPNDPVGIKFGVGIFAKASLWAQVKTAVSKKESPWKVKRFASQDDSVEKKWLQATDVWKDLLSRTLKTQAMLPDVIDFDEWVSRSSGLSPNIRLMFDQLMGRQGLEDEDDVSVSYKAQFLVSKLILTRQLDQRFYQSVINPVSDYLWAEVSRDPKWMAAFGSSKISEFRRKDLQDPLDLLLLMKGLKLESLLTIEDFFQRASLEQKRDMARILVIDNPYAFTRSESKFDDALRELFRYIETQDIYFEDSIVEISRDELTESVKAFETHLADFDLWSIAINLIQAGVAEKATQGLGKLAQSLPMPYSWMYLNHNSFKVDHFLLLDSDFLGSDINELLNVDLSDSESMLSDIMSAVLKPQAIEAEQNLAVEAYFPRKVKGGFSMDTRGQTERIKKITQDILKNASDDQILEVLGPYYASKGADAKAIAQSFWADGEKVMSYFAEIEKRYVQVLIDLKAANPSQPEYEIKPESYPFLLASLSALISHAVSEDDQKTVKLVNDISAQLDWSLRDLSQWKQFYFRESAASGIAENATHPKDWARALRSFMLVNTRLGDNQLLSTLVSSRQKQGENHQVLLPLDKMQTGLLKGGIADDVDRFISTMTEEARTTLVFDTAVQDIEDDYLYRVISHIQQEAGRDSLSAIDGLSLMKDGKNPFTQVSPETNNSDRSKALRNMLVLAGIEGQVSQPERVLSFLDLHALFIRTLGQIESRSDAEKLLGYYFDTLENRFPILISRPSFAEIEAKIRRSKLTETTESKQIIAWSALNATMPSVNKIESLLGLPTNEMASVAGFVAQYDRMEKTTKVVKDSIALRLKANADLMEQASVLLKAAPSLKTLEDFSGAEIEEKISRLGLNDFDLFKTHFTEMGIGQEIFHHIAVAPKTFSLAHRVLATTGRVMFAVMIVDLFMGNKIFAAAHGATSYILWSALGLGWGLHWWDEMKQIYSVTPEQIERYRGVINSLPNHGSNGFVSNEVLGKLDFKQSLIDNHYDRTAKWSIFKHSVGGFFAVGLPVGVLASRATMDLLPYLRGFYNQTFARLTSKLIGRDKSLTDFLMTRFADESVGIYDDGKILLNVVRTKMLFKREIEVLRTLPKFKKDPKILDHLEEAMSLGKAGEKADADAVVLYLRDIRRPHLRALAKAPIIQQRLEDFQVMNQIAKDLRHVSFVDSWIQSQESNYAALQRAIAVLKQNWDATTTPLGVKIPKTDDFLLKAMARRDPDTDGLYMRLRKLRAALFEEPLTKADSAFDTATMEEAVTDLSFSQAFDIVERILKDAKFILSRSGVRSVSENEVLDFLKLTADKRVALARKALAKMGYSPMKVHNFTPADFVPLPKLEKPSFVEARGPNLQRLVDAPYESPSELVGRVSQAIAERTIPANAEVRAADTFELIANAISRNHPAAFAELKKLGLMEGKFNANDLRLILRSLASKGQDAKKSEDELSALTRDSIEILAAYQHYRALAMEGVLEDRSVEVFAEALYRLRRLNVPDRMARGALGVIRQNDMRLAPSEWRSFFRSDSQFGETSKALESVFLELQNLDGNHGIKKAGVDDVLESLRNVIKDVSAERARETESLTLFVSAAEKRAANVAPDRAEFLKLFSESVRKAGFTRSMDVDSATIVDKLIKSDASLSDLENLFRLFREGKATWVAENEQSLIDTFCLLWLAKKHYSAGTNFAAVFESGSLSGTGLFSEYANLRKLFEIYGKKGFYFAKKPSSYKEVTEMSFVDLVATLEGSRPITSINDAKMLLGVAPGTSLAVAEIRNESQLIVEMLAATQSSSRPGLAFTKNSLIEQMSERVREARDLLLWNINSLDEKLGSMGPVIKVQCEEKVNFITAALKESGFDIAAVGMEDVTAIFNGENITTQVALRTIRNVRKSMLEALLPQTHGQLSLEENQRRLSAIDEIFHKFNELERLIQGVKSAEIMMIEKLPVEDIEVFLKVISDAANRRMQYAMTEEEAIYIIESFLIHNGYEGERVEIGRNILDQNFFETVRAFVGAIRGTSNQSDPLLSQAMSRIDIQLLNKGKFSFEEVIPKAVSQDFRLPVEVMLDSALYNRTSLRTLPGRLRQSRVVDIAEEVQAVEQTVATDWNTFVNGMKAAQGKAANRESFMEQVLPALMYAKDDSAAFSNARKAIIELQKAYDKSIDLEVAAMRANGQVPDLERIRKLRGVGILEVLNTFVNNRLHLVKHYPKDLTNGFMKAADRLEEIHQDL